MSKKYYPNKTDAGEVAQGEDKTLAEHGVSNGIELQSENDIIKAAEIEAFMNQLVTIVVATDGTQGAYDVITPNVNGTNQPIIRGEKQQVKRKYVEALAHSRLTVYKQKTPDATRPENFVMEEVTVMAYPFQVLDDPHPDGGPWLQNLLAQP